MAGLIKIKNLPTTLEAFWITECQVGSLMNSVKRSS